MFPKLKPAKVDWTKLTPEEKVIVESMLKDYRDINEALRTALRNKNMGTLTALKTQIDNLKAKYPHLIKE